MKRLFFTTLILIGCANTSAQSEGRNKYTYTAPADWMAMQTLLVLANDQNGRSTIVNSASARGRTIEERQVITSGTNSLDETDNILRSMCLKLLAGRYEGLSGAIAISAERIRMESAREDAIRNQYSAYLAKLTPEESTRVEDQRSKLASQMVDSKIDWERYAREDTELFFKEQTTTCNRI